MPAHMPSTATPVRYEFKAKSLWTKVDKAQPLKNLARRFAVAVRLYSRGVWFYAPFVVGALPSACIVAVCGFTRRLLSVRVKNHQKDKNKNGAPLWARRLGVACLVLCVGGCFFGCSIFAHIFRALLFCISIFCAFVGGCVDLRRVDKG